MEANPAAGGFFEQQPVALCACVSSRELYSARRHGGLRAVIPNQLVLTSVKLLIFFATPAPVELNSAVVDRKRLSLSRVGA